MAADGRIGGPFRRLTRWTLVGILVTGLLAVPASAATEVARPTQGLSRVSSVVAFRYGVAHPETAPPEQAAAMRAVARAAREGVPTGQLVSRARTRDLFNRDSVGLPQNEESVT